MSRNSQVKVFNTLALNQRCREYQADGNARRLQQAQTELGEAIASLSETELQSYQSNLNDTTTDWVRELSCL